MSGDAVADKAMAGEAMNLLKNASSTLETLVGKLQAGGRRLRKRRSRRRKSRKSRRGRKSRRSSKRRRRTRRRRRR